jgi:hypothetical protein
MIFIKEKSMKNLFELSEEEKNKIRDLHESHKSKLGTSLNEQDTSQKKIVLPLSATFDSGKYIIRNSEQLDPVIIKIGEFLKTVPQKQKTNITISAGESQVPNRDREKEGNPRMEQGDLAKNRMSELENVVKEKFGNLPNVTINKTEPVIGKTPWDPAKGAQDPNYTKEQFVNITLEISGKIDAPETNKPKCEKYDFYFKNRILRTYDKTNAIKFLNALTENPQSGLIPNCVNYVGELYQSSKPSIKNTEYESYFPNTKGFIGYNDKLYKSEKEYNKDSNIVWFDPMKQYNMTSI